MKQQRMGTQGGIEAETGPVRAFDLHFKRTASGETPERSSLPNLAMQEHPEEAMFSGAAPTREPLLNLGGK